MIAMEKGSTRCHLGMGATKSKLPQIWTMQGRQAIYSHEGGWQSLVYKLDYMSRHKVRVNNGVQIPDYNYVQTPSVWAHTRVVWVHTRVVYVTYQQP